MKRFTLTILSVFALLFVSTAVLSTKSYAVDVLTPACNQSSNNKTVTNPDGTTSHPSQPDVCKDNLSSSDSPNPLLGPDGLITKGVQIFLIAFGITAVFVLIINGVRFITSAGDAKTAESARDGIIYAAIGIVIAISAQLIVSFVLTKV